jgi:hypothetical protein
MNITWKDTTMSHYVLYLSIILLLLCGLTFLLAGCDKILPGTRSKGGEVEIHIRLGGLSYNEEEIGARSHSDPPPVIESEEIDLGDGLFLSGTMTLDTDETLRASSPLAEGVQLHVVVYVAGTGVPVANAGYVIKGGAMEVTGDYLKAPAGTYDIVAYSFNSATAPGYQTVLTADPHTSDLIWGKAVNQVVDEGTGDVTISLRHLFSRVKVVISTTNVTSRPAIQSVGNVTIGPSYTGSLTVLSGQCVNTGASQPVTLLSAANRWKNLNTPTVTSLDTIIYAGVNAENITLSLASITMAGYSTTNLGTALPIRFNRKMEPGKAYTLNIAFRKVTWAGSNVYWDGTKLTFAEAGVTTYRNYQGVHFKWGSVIGISATAGIFDHATPMYVYRFDTNPPRWSTTYIDRITLDDANDSDTWEEIPMVSTGNSRYDRTTNYLATMHTDSFTLYKGDICRMIGLRGGPTGYRMPSSAEFGGQQSNWNGTTPVAGGWRWVTGTVSPTIDPAGKRSIATGADTYGGSSVAVHFPVAGVRNRELNSGTLGHLAYAGTDGYYWSGTVFTGNSAFYLRFSSGNVAPEVSTVNYIACSIRCVKN